MYTSIHIGVPSPDLLNEWKATCDEYISYIKPKEKNASQVLDFVMGKYPFDEETSADARKVVECNALGYRNYLPDGVFKDGLDIAVLKIKHESFGETLYRRQRQDYKELIEEYREQFKDAEDLPDEDFPIPIIVGIEKRSGFVYVEGSPLLSDEITMLQGLNEKELSNIYLVARYIKVLKKYDRLKYIAK